MTTETSRKKKKKKKRRRRRGCHVLSAFPQIIIAYFPFLRAGAMVVIHDQMRAGFLTKFYGVPFIGTIILEAGICAPMYQKNFPELSRQLFELLFHYE